MPPIFYIIGQGILYLINKRKRQKGSCLLLRIGYRVFGSVNIRELKCDDIPCPHPQIGKKADGGIHTLS